MPTIIMEIIFFVSLLIDAFLWRPNPKKISGTARIRVPKTVYAGYTFCKVFNFEMRCALSTDG